MKTSVSKRTVRVGLIAAALFAVAAGIAYATIPDSNGVYTACKLNLTGTIRLIDPALGDTSLLGHCTTLETKITWNQQGQSGAQGPAGPAGKDGTNGKDGISVTSIALSAGDANCPNGGSKFTSGSGVTYACSAPPEAPSHTGAITVPGVPGSQSGSIFYATLTANGAASSTEGAQTLLPAGSTIHKLLGSVAPSPLGLSYGTLQISIRVLVNGGGRAVCNVSGPVCNWIDPLSGASASDIALPSDSSVEFEIDVQPLPDSNYVYPPAPAFTFSYSWHE